jgi:hypothetical protein
VAEIRRVGFGPAGSAADLGWLKFGMLGLDLLEVQRTWDG